MEIAYQYAENMSYFPPYSKQDLTLLNIRLHKIRLDKIALY